MTDPGAGGAESERALIVTPTRRDLEVTIEILDRAGVRAHACANLPSLAREIEAGVGVVILTDGALAAPTFDVAAAAIAAQPPWSDIPVVVLAGTRRASASVRRRLAALTNVTLLDRPTSKLALVSAVQAALRARRRQYQIRDHLERQRAAEQALRDADRRKDHFLATLAHELRNPLAPIRTGLQTLRRTGGDGPEAAALREMMERQLRQLVRLIDELLDVSRIATGKVVLQRERVDLRDVVDGAIEGAQPLLEVGRQALQWGRPDAPLCVLCDRSRLTQAVGNLIANACKYSPPASVVSVTLERQGDDAVLAVADRGAGIPADMLESIFDMFTQVERTLDRSQGGLGIGLSLVRQLIEQHGGSVHAESDGVDLGSRFVLRLPLLDPVSGRADGAREPADAPVPAPGRSLRVLVVDDNVDAADSLSMLLEAEGHHARTAYSGQAAVAAAADFRPDAVLCDIGMPGMDGHAVARALRADARHAATLLVALTGWGTDDDKRRTREAGFDAHLVKPIGLDDLASVLGVL